MHLVIKIPDNNIAERKYSVEVIMRWIIGIEYSIIIGEDDCYEIVFGNNIITFNDAFWGHFPNGKSYLDVINIPSSFVTSNQFCIEKDIPILYGDNVLNVKDHNISCGIDVFASSFFMLTRWEEYVNKARGTYDRFSAKDSIAYKYGFLSRPIVNEYAEMLWNMLVYLGYEGKRKERHFSIIPTHDLDSLYYKHFLYQTIKSSLGDIVKRKDIKLAKSRWNKYKEGDPYDTFSFLMDCSEKANVKSHFYFMSSDVRTDKFSTANYLHNKNFSRIIEEIQVRGHIIGFHPGYYSYNNTQEWIREKEMLEKSLGFSVEEGRQHYLRFEMPSTMSIWEENNMRIDSTLTYYDKEGFRCGTGDEYPFFDFLKRKRMSINERPLIIMDGTLNGYQHMSLDKVNETLNHYCDVSKKYEMPLTVLFHNSSFCGDRWNGWDDIYTNLLRYNR